MLNQNPMSTTRHRVFNLIYLLLAQDETVLLIGVEVESVAHIEGKTRNLLSIGSGETRAPQTAI